MRSVYVFIFRGVIYCLLQVVCMIYFVLGFASLFLGLAFHLQTKRVCFLNVSECFVLSDDGKSYDTY